MQSTPEQLSKTSKTGHFGVLERKSCDSSLKYENFKITQPDCQDREKRMTKYMCYESLLLMTIFFQLE